MALINPNLDPSARELRRFATIWLPGFCALLGGAVFYRTGSLGTAAAIWAGALFVSGLGLWSPRFMRLVYLGLVRLAFPIGLVVSTLLLAFIYYLVITPVGIVWRACGNDPLQRARNELAGSYWIRYSPPEQAKRYFEQF
jgi:hypothetical protein